MRPTFLLCEGVHDIALLGLLLERLGFKHFSEPLKKYPQTISRFLVKRLQDRPVDEARSRSEDQPAADLIPLFFKAYHKEDSLILLFLTKGDSHNLEIARLLSVIVDLSSDRTPKETRMTPFGIFFTRDADNVGIEGRVLKIKEDFAACLKECFPSLEELAHGKVVSNGGFSVGCWIFSKPGDQYGILEDALIGDFRKHFESRWKDAEDYLMRHGKWKNPSSKYLKATMTVVGQPDYPGFSQTVVLREVLKEPTVSESLCQAFKHCQSVLLEVIGTPN